MRSLARVNGQKAHRACLTHVIRRYQPESWQRQSDIWIVGLIVNKVEKACHVAAIKSHIQKGSSRFKAGKLIQRIACMLALKNPRHVIQYNILHSLHLYLAHQEK